MAQSPVIFDRNLLRVRRARATARGPETFLLDRVATELSERLAVVLRKFELAADLGTPGGAVLRVLESMVGRAIAVDARLSCVRSGPRSPLRGFGSFAIARRCARSCGVGARIAVRQ